MKDVTDELDTTETMTIKLKSVIELRENDNATIAPLG